MKLDEVVARCVSGELVPGTPSATDALWNVLCDPTEWKPDELFAMLAPLQAHASKREETGVLKIERPTVVVGDLIVDGDLECLSHTLVLGSVRCTGYLYSGIHDCLIVAGDLEARALEALRSYWVIGGSMRAETIWLSTYGSLNQRSSMRTRLLVVQQYFELLRDEDIVADTRIETEYLPDDEVARRRLTEVIDIEGLLDTEGQFDNWELLRRVARGERVFR